MREERRQACLQALGLSPWVARTRLPGAAPSPQPEAPAPEPEAPAPEPETPVPEAEVPAAQARTPEPAPAEAETGGESEPASAATEAAGQPDTGLHFTLHALATPALLLMVQQADPYAPEPGRDEQRLLGSLLRYFNADDAGARTLAWPLPGADNEAEQARATLEAFTGRLCSDHRLQRVLWLLDEDLSRILLGQRRFTRFGWCELDCLAVAGPGEMLRDPVTHKRASWQAMVRYGFVL